MRTGTGVRCVDGYTLCDKPGCPADGRVINPDTHFHGTDTGLMPTLADLLDYCRAELEESYGGRYDGFADVIRWIEGALPKATTDGVQSGVQRDPTEPRMTQVRDVTGGT